MPGKFSLKPPVRRSKEAGPISIKEAKVIEPGNMRIDKVNPTLITFLGPDGTPLAEKILEERQKNAETLRQRLKGKGIDYDAYHACFAGCPAAALCGLPQKKLFSEEKTLQEAQPSLIINMDGLDKKEEPPKKEYVEEPEPKLNIRYVKKAETVLPSIPLSAAEKVMPAPEQEIKPVQPKINKVEATPPVKLSIKIPEQRTNTEVPVQPVEKPNHIKLIVPRELPENIIKKFRQKRHLIENSEAEKSPQKVKQVLETFKNKVNKFFTKVVKPEVRSVKEIPVKQSSVSVKKGRVQGIFDRLIHFERMRKKPLIKELKKGPDKIDFSKPLKLGFLTLLPLSKIDRKFKPRRLTLSRLIRIINKQPTIEAGATNKKVAQKRLIQQPEVKPILTTQIKEIKKTRTGILIKEIKRALLKEKQTPFALIILPISNEATGEKKNQAEESVYEVTPISEKTFFKLISLSEKLSKVINFLSLKENRKIIQEALTVDVENILPSQEEIQTTIKTYAYNMRLVLWYMSRVLLSFNKLNLYLLET